MITKIKKIGVSNCFDCPFGDKNRCSADCAITLKDKSRLPIWCPLRKMSFLIQMKETKKKEKK